MKDSMKRWARSGVALAVVAAGWFGSAAHAVDSTITVKGEVYAEPCTVDSSSKNLTIDFGKVPAQNLQTAKSATAWQYPNGGSMIKLSNCPAGTRSVVAKFDGAADADNAGMFKNSGSATQVSIWLTLSGAGNSSIAPGGTRTAAVSNGAASFNVGARLYTEKGSVTAGNVSSTISVTLSYQ